jgi:WS/DGAT/MGAT family acyltransferase
MPQEHGDRLGAVDASFLAQETPSAHMHVGAVLIFEGPAPAYDVFADHIRSRLHLVPRYRQRLAFPPLDPGRPLWVDDEGFDVDHHLRHVALPAPGDEDVLRALAARIHSEPLDRSRPLWELWLVEGLDGGRFAIVSKAHHALVDGIAGVDLATALLDLERDPPAPPHPPTAWTPSPPPGGADVTARGLSGLARIPLGLAKGALYAAARPAEALALARDVANGLGEVAAQGLTPAPVTPLNVPIGPHRRLAWVRCELDEFKRIKNAAGATVNDVVLAVVAGALGRWLRDRGERTQGLELRALIPVSVRTDDQRGELGNRIVAMRGPLPVGIEDPLGRVHAVKYAMDALKGSRQAMGAETISLLQGLAPFGLLAQASRVNFSTRLFNLLVTNVPGPQFPLYLLGRRLSDLFPVAFLPPRHALSVAIMSYDGRMDFGLLGDYEALRDLDDLAAMTADALAETLAAAERRPVSSPGRTSRPPTSSRATTEA